MDPNQNTPATPPADTPAGVTPPTPPQAPDAATSFAPFTPAEAPIQQPAAAPEGVPPVVPAPAPVVAPIPGGSPVPTSGTGKKPKTGLIIGIAGGAVALVLAIIGVILGLSLNSVSKTDYADAVKPYNELGGAYSKLTGDTSLLASGIMLSSSRYDKYVSDAEADLTATKTANDTFAKMKAVKVGEGKKLYDALNTKLKAYMQNSADLIASAKTARPALAKCDAADDASAGSARATALNDCATALKAVGDMPNAELKAYIVAIQQPYADYAANYQAMSALSNPYGAQYDQYKALRDKVYAAQDQLRKASDAYSKDAIAKLKSLSLKSESDALGDYLDKKQRS